MDRPLAASIPLSYAVLSTTSVATFARLRRYQLFRSSQLGLTLLLPFALALALGGLAGSSGVVLWSLTCPLGALVFAGYREARLWFLGFLTIMAASFLLEPVVSDRAGLPNFTVVLFLAMNISAVSTIAFVLLQYFTSQREAAQETSEALLLNILPRSIADALKRSPQTIAEHYEGASVLFADVVDFTPMSARMSPTDLVELLNDVFTYFDEVADELGIETIQNDRRLLHGRFWRSRPAPRPRQHRHRNGASSPRPRRFPRLPRPPTPVPHRHPLRTDGGRGHRHPQIHLRPLG